MKASEVIRIGRKRSRAASTAAAEADRPSSCFSTAYSTIRIAFFAARPSSVTRPIWKYTSLVRPRSQTAASAPKVPNGSASSTESGSDHFSYCAARIRNTISAPSASTSTEVPPDLFSWYEAPLQSRLKLGRQHLARDALDLGDRLARAHAGLAAAEHLHRRQVVEARHACPGRCVYSMRASERSGIISPFSLRT